MIGSTAVRGLLLAAFAICIASAVAQTAGQDFTFQVSPAQLWTDTGLDLQSGDVLEITASGSLPGVGGRACDPAGGNVPGNQYSTTALPLPSAPVGALIARLHAQGATPVLIGASNKLEISEPSHLSLGMNLAGSSCEGNITVKIHKGSSSTTAEGQQGRKAQLRSQLSSAAQIFMSGQFGEKAASSEAASGEGSGSAAPAPPALNLSSAPLDAELRRDIDGLPRRVNDQFQNLGDMVNFVIVGSQKDVQAALEAASWHVADTSNKGAVLSAIEETYDQKDYLQMPMSTLYLFGRKQDFGYEMAEPIAMVASRHHFRIWKAPFTWKGQEVWVGAGTHDIGFAKDKRNGSVTHKIDPSVDGERDNIGGSLQKADKTKTLTYYLPPNPVQDAKNATGDGYHSDGRLLVIFVR
jgi:LssY C-terminus